MFIMLYVTSLVLTYLITGRLTAYIQFPLPSFPTSGNHRSDLFSI